MTPLPWQPMLEEAREDLLQCTQVVSTGRAAQSICPAKGEVEGSVLNYKTTQYIKIHLLK